MDVQTILIIILALLTINLIIVGVYVILVLNEVRKTVKKANAVFDVVKTVSKTVAVPLASLSGVAASLFEGVKLFGVIKHLVSGSDDEEDEDE